MKAEHEGAKEVTLCDKAAGKCQKNLINQSQLATEKFNLSNGMVRMSSLLILPRS